MMKIALLQRLAVLGDVPVNQSNMEAAFAAAMRNNPDVVVLPELWNTGFFPADVKAVAERDGCGSRELLKRLAGRFQVNVVGGSVAECEDGVLYNTNYTLDRTGRILAAYRKIHLFSPAGEHQVFAAGTRIGTFQLDGVKAAVAICYDIRFCELIRLLALEGISILFVSAAWPQPRLAHWQTLLRARAIENQLFVAAANSVGTAKQLQFCGGSTLIDPWGEVIAEAGEEETILTGTLDLSVGRDIRRRMDVFADRRDSLYALTFRV